jgi:hypothetical protein
MLTLAGKEQQLHVPSPHDALSQADHAQKALWHCNVKVQKQPTNRQKLTHLDTHLRKSFTLL